MTENAKAKGKALTLRIFRCDASAQYAKYVMAQIDINFALQCLVRLRSMLQSDSRDDVVCESLWNASLIRLFSVFDGPNAISKDILDELPEGAREAYSFFEIYRNKNIAHKVNPIDQIKAGIILSDPDEGKKELLAVGNLAMADASFADPEFLNSFGQFVDALRRRIDFYISEWSNKTLEEARKRPIDELYKMPPLRIVVPNSKYLHRGGT